MNNNTIHVRNHNKINIKYSSWNLRYDQDKMINEIVKAFGEKVAI